MHKLFRLELNGDTASLVHQNGEARVEYGILSRVRRDLQKIMVVERKKLVPLMN